MKNISILALLLILAAPQIMAFSCYELQDPYQQQACVHQEEMIRLQRDEMVNNNFHSY